MDIIYNSTRNKNNKATASEAILKGLASDGGLFVPDEILNLGMIIMHRRDASFRIYDKERMLIELLSRKNSLPRDYYKEIIGNYRRLIYNLDIERIQDYAESFPRSKMISDALGIEIKSPIIDYKFELIEDKFLFLLKSL